MTLITNADLQAKPVVVTTAAANDAYFERSATRFDGGYDRPVRKTSGLIITVLLHLLVLWMILNHKAIINASKKGGEVITMILTPESSGKPKSPPPAKQAAKKMPKTAQVRTDVITPPTLAPVPVQPPAEREAVREPEQDMSSMLDAARKRRAEAQRAQSDNEESEADRAMRIAKANIARGNKGRDDESGGVFELRRVGVSSGEFIFNGWSAQRGRKAQQAINVQGNNSEDIEVSIVRRMLVLIREEKPGDFVWESHRLGRNVNLNSGPEHTEELIAFLLKEFFPRYIPSRRR